jgi:hypothetical protein
MVAFSILWPTSWGEKLSFRLFTRPSVLAAEHNQANKQKLYHMKVAFQDIYHPFMDGY